MERAWTKVLGLGLLVGVGLLMRGWGLEGGEAEEPFPGWALAWMDRLGWCSLPCLEDAAASFVFLSGWTDLADDAEDAKEEPCTPLDGGMVCLDSMISILSFNPRSLELETKECFNRFSPENTILLNQE